MTLKACIYVLRTEASSLKKTNPAAACTLEDRAKELQNAISAAVKSKLASEDSDSDSGSEPVWMRAELEAYVEGHTSESGNRTILLIEGRPIDVTLFRKEYMSDFLTYSLPQL